MVPDFLALQQPSGQVQRLIRPAAACRGIHTTNLKLVSILTADPDAEHEATGGQSGDLGQLARHRDGMAEGQQVQADVHRNRTLSGQHRGRDRHTVEALAVVKADVVSDMDVVDALSGLLDEAERIQLGRPEKDAGHAQTYFW
jgi:hypothetical protein